MKTEQITLMTSVEIAADLTKNHFIGFDGALCSADAKALGVLNADTLSGEMAPIGVSGIALVYSGAAVAQGEEVKSDSAGKAVPGTSLAVASDITSLTATLPADATPVTSDSANPTITVGGTIANTVSGSLVTEKINGIALDAATGADELIRVLLR